MDAVPVEDDVWLGAFWPKEDRPLTVDDLTRLPHDGNRYELVDGTLEVTPAPLNKHNRVTLRLAVLLDERRPDDLEVLPGNGVNLARDRQRIPDIVVVRSEWVEQSDFIEQPPLLAVEVASNSTRSRDRIQKRREYEAFGIESYWIVEPDVQRPTLTAYDLNDAGYEQVAVVSGDEAFHATRPFPVTIVPALLVANGNAWRSGLG